MPNVKQLTWVDFQVLLIPFYIKIAHTNKKYDAIIGLSRGGLVPAVCLSNIMDIPLIPVQYSSKRGAGNDKNHANVVPIMSDITGKQSQHTLLIVDDICDTGYTLKEVCGELRAQGHEVVTATIHYKSGAVITPDVYIEHLDPDSPWIVYPWEKPQTPTEEI